MYGSVTTSSSRVYTHLHMDKIREGVATESAGGTPNGTLSNGAAITLVYYLKRARGSCALLRRVSAAEWAGQGERAA